MIVLDTNVVSELTSPSPHQPVFRWVASQIPSAVYTTTITLAEVLIGIEIMPVGKRRKELATAAELMFERVYRGRILPFDEAAARAFARVGAKRDGQSGRSISRLQPSHCRIAPP